MNIEFISHVDRVFLNIYFHSSFVLKISVALVKSILKSTSKTLNDNYLVPLLRIFMAKSLLYQDVDKDKS